MLVFIRHTATFGLSVPLILSFHFCSGNIPENVMLLIYVTTRIHFYCMWFCEIISFSLEGQEWSVRMGSASGLMWTIYSVFIIGGAKEVMTQIQWYKSQSDL